MAFGGFRFGVRVVILTVSRRLLMVLGTPPRRLAGAEGRSRESQGFPNPHYVRVRAAEHAPRGPFQLLERRHGLADIVEDFGRGGRRE